MKYKSSDFQKHYKNKKFSFKSYSIPKKIKNKEISLPLFSPDTFLNYTQINIPNSMVCNMEINPCSIQNNALYLTAKQIMDDPDIKYSKTYLYQFIQKNTPTTMGEIYGLSKNHPLHSLSPHYLFEPWIHDQPIADINNSLAGIFGPKDNSFVETEIDKLKKIIHSIQKYGYHPLSFPDRSDGYIIVEILSHENEYKCKIIAGHHRIAVLAALGYDKFPSVFLQKKHLKERNLINNIRYQSKFKNPFYISSNNIPQWPSVISGFLTPSQAEEIFLSYFRA